MVFSVCNPHITSSIHGHIVWAVKFGIPVKPVNQSAFTSWTASEQHHIPARVYLPDLVVSDICDIKVSRPVASHASRIVESGVIG